MKLSFKPHHSTWASNICHVAVTSGHMIGLSNQVAQGAGSGPSGSKTGRSPTKFSPIKTAPADGSPSNKSKQIEALRPRANCSPSSVKGKGKATEIPVEASDDGETASEEDFGEESKEEVKPKGRGRPRKDILKDAAKRMKRS
ncbi:hypothetical protein PtB15_18B102 [Puccinia triticina]|nr:hypothetical protein PtB15_18B102 [Puccinia triticina]